MQSPVAMAQPVPGRRRASSLHAPRLQCRAKIPAADEGDAENADAGQPLVEEVVGADGHEGHAHAPGHGIDDGEVARLIRLAEGEEVHAVQDDRGHHERKGAGEKPSRART